MKKALTLPLLALVSLAFANTVRAGGNDQCFLKIDGIQGESTSQNHPNEIELVGFRTGLTQQIANSATGGAGVGKPNFSPLKVFKHIDKASIPVFVACAVGKHLKTVTLSVVKFSDFPAGPYDYFVVVLSDVLVSSVNDGTETTDGEGNLLETVTFEYAKIEWTYKPTNQDGSPGTPVKGGYDLKLNKKL